MSYIERFLIWLPIYPDISLSFLRRKMSNWSADMRYRDKTALLDSSWSFSILCSLKLWSLSVLVDFNYVLFYFQLKICLFHKKLFSLHFNLSTLISPYYKIFKQFSSLAWTVKQLSPKKLTINFDDYRYLFYFIQGKLK